MSALLDCGHPPSAHDASTTGYGSDEDGQRYCYECCAEKDRERARSGQPISAYLTDDPERHSTYLVTTWPGVVIGRAHAMSKYKVRNSAYGTHMVCVSARICGREYYGRGFGAGMCINLRARSTK